VCTLGSQAAPSATGLRRREDRKYNKGLYKEIITIKGERASLRGPLSKLSARDRIIVATRACKERCGDDRCRQEGVLVRGSVCKYALQDPLPRPASLCKA
jgi:hypothetical protein